MENEALNLKTAELKYHVNCPICKETFNVKPGEVPFVQKCVFCKHSFWVVTQKAKEKEKSFAIAS